MQSFPKTNRTLVAVAVIFGLTGAFVTTAWQLGQFGVAPCVARIAEVADGRGPMWDSRSKSSGDIATEDYGNRLAPTFRLSREQHDGPSYLLHLEDVWGMRPGWFGRTADVGVQSPTWDGKDVLHWNVIVSGPLAGHVWARSERKANELLIYSFGWACRDLQKDQGPFRLMLRAPQAVCDAAAKYQ